MASAETRGPLGYVVVEACPWTERFGVHGAYSDEAQEDEGWAECGAWTQEEAEAYRSKLIATHADVGETLRAKAEDGQLFADMLHVCALEPIGTPSTTASVEPEGASVTSGERRCDKCGQREESTVHMVDHANAEIRTGAHAFVPAVERYTLEEVAAMLEGEARMGRLPGRVAMVASWLRAGRSTSEKERAGRSEGTE